MRTNRVRWFLQGCALALLVVGTTGCGELTIRSWVKIVTAESSGSVQITFFGQKLNLALSRVQGGFDSTVKIDTREILNGPLQGSIELNDVRVAAQGQGSLGKVCTWLNPNASSIGQVVLDLGGGPSQAGLIIALKATSGLSKALNLPDSDLVQFALFPLDEGVSLDTLLAAQQSGVTDGLFASTTTFHGTTKIGNIPAEFNLNIKATNDAEPPLFDADMLSFCGSSFDQQGADLFYGLNSKSTYLRVEQGDTAAAPLAISLAEIGAQAGDTLHLAPAGTYSDLNVLKDGSETRLTGVFSSSNVVGPPSDRYRIPGAIDAGTNVTTESYLECFLLLCALHSSDIPQDFRIDPGVDVVVPAGAQYVFVSPTPNGQWWSDNSGFGFGVTVEVK
jgi:hypothetical protein